MKSATSEHADALVARLGDRDRAGASHLVKELEERGATPVDLIGSLLASAQRRVGRLWQANEWSVVDEHAATAIVDRLLADVARTIDAVPSRPEIVVCCPEGEWHSMPARMFTEMQRATGRPVTFLGGSTPAEQLDRVLADRRPLGVALSCTVPIFLTAALRSVQVAAEHGTPVLAGGAAFGSDDVRARAVGASAWARDAETAEQILDDWMTGPPPPPPRPRDPGAALALAADRPEVVDAAMVELEAMLPDLAAIDARQPGTTRENLDYALRYAEAAVLTGDARIFTEFVVWHEQLLTARGIPAATVDLTLSTLHDVLGEQHAEARQLLASAPRR